MTPERAAELALIYANNYFRARTYEHATRLSVFVEEAIFAACNEQREQDAKIADRLSKGNAAGGELSAGQIIAATTIAAAIRSAE